MNLQLNWKLCTILLILPCSFLIAFTHYPAVQALLNSFWNNASSRRPSKFIGLKNYEALIQDDKLIQVLLNSTFYAIGTIPIAIILAIVMALLVNSRLPATALMRLSFFMPTMLPMVAVANIWLFFYAPGIGLTSQILSIFGIPPINFLGDTEISLISMMIVAIWKEAGLFMIFYLAALQSVPQHLKDAAKLEGAESVRIIFDIILPLLKPTTIFVAVNALINAFRMIDHIIVMTRGGPNNSSALLLYYIFDVTFGHRDFAYGATLTVLMVLILGVMATVQFWFLDRKAHYQ
ncbi:MAG: sugar ABC transporter permease [Deltaproteobacteria bacterium]